MPRKTQKKSIETRYTSQPVAAKPALAKSIESKPVPLPAKAIVEAPTKLGASIPATAASKIPVQAQPSPAAAKLIAELQHSDADTARDAATSLAALGESTAVQPLIDVLKNTDDYYHPVVRAAAAAGLGRLGDSRAVDALLSTINDSLAEPSAEAIRALAAIGDPRAVGALVEVIRNSNGFFLPIARRAAVLALSKFGADAQAAAELLIVSTNPWEDPIIRQDATDALRSTKSSA